MKVIVYCLWGNDTIYWVGALRNIKLAEELYPDWTCRFYIDSNSDVELIKTISGSNVEVILMDSKVTTYENLSDRFNHSGLFWRFLPLLEKDIDIVISRDCDSRISRREVDAVNEWLLSNKDFHIMRDHPYHQVPILSGMWGCRNNILSNIDELLQKWEYNTNKGIYHAEDQDFLGQIIYPIVSVLSFEHSEFNIVYNNEVHNFPNIRNDYEFIGDVFNENDVRHSEYWQNIKQF